MLGFSLICVSYVLFYMILNIGWYGTQQKSLIKPESKINYEDLTVIIPFRNEQENLSMLLKNINELKKVPSRFIFIMTILMTTGRAYLKIKTIFQLMFIR